MEKPQNLQKSIWIRPIILIGVISLFADVASDMLYAVWPLYLTGTLGASLVALGLIEGLAELIAGVFKIYAGRWSDKWGRRRIFVFWGYFLAAISKPLTGFASVWPQALAARGLDRFGKGIRTAPRDALLADWAPADQLGRVFGFHRAMDTLGATLGPLVTLSILFAWPNTPLSQLFFWAVIPGFIAAILVLGVPERKPQEIFPGRLREQSWRQALKQLPREFYWYLLVWTIFSIANSSDVFLLLRVKEIGGTQTQVILTYCFYNLIYAMLSFPLGLWADRKGPHKIFVTGLILFSVVYGVFAVGKSWPILLAAFFLYGIFSAATDGVGKSMILQGVPKNLKATAIGLFVGVSGIAALFASTFCGLLWEKFGSVWSFGFSAVVSTMAAVIFLLRKPGSVKSQGIVEHT